MGTSWWRSIDRIGEGRGVRPVETCLAWPGDRDAEACPETRRQECDAEKDQACGIFRRGKLQNSETDRRGR